jgi:hypothetical protein
MLCSLLQVSCQMEFFLRLLGGCVPSVPSEYVYCVLCFISEHWLPKRIYIVTK